MSSVQGRSLQNAPSDEEEEEKSENLLSRLQTRWKLRKFMMMNYLRCYINVIGLIMNMMMAYHHYDNEL